MKYYASFSDYLADQSPAARKLLRKLRSIIRKEAPGVLESISYGMPAYKSNGILVYIGGFRHHCSLFAMPSAVTHFRKQLVDYATSKGTIQFPLDAPLPEPLIRKIIRFRVQENLQKKKRQPKSGK